MEEFQKEFAENLAGSKGNPLFFGEGLRLKDGRETPYFVNIGGFSETASGIVLLGHYYGNMLKCMMEKGIPMDIISGPSYKASAIAQAAVTGLYIEHEVDLGFNYDRKEEKTHGEASGAGTLFVGAGFRDGCNVVIVDDVGTSMQTKIDFMDKIQREASALEIKVNVTAVLIGVDREQVGPVYRQGYDPKQHSKQNKDWVIHNARGKDAIKEFTDRTGIPVYSVLGIRDCLDHLCNVGASVAFKHKDGTISKERMTDDFLDVYFRPYMGQYGVEGR